MVKKHFFATITIASLSTAAFGAQNSCNMPQYAVCVESTSLDVGGEECTRRGGSIGENCETANRFASCTIAEDSNLVFVRYYNGFPPDQAESNCSENDGLFTRD
jgi:hypothetical protein